MNRAPHLSDDSVPTALHIGPAAHRVCDALGDLMAFWGFPRSHGRIWALLYLHDRPLHAGEIAESLELSSGQVSMSLRDLEHWSVVHPQRQPGQRRTWYHPEINLFRMIATVFAQRELQQVRTMAQTLQVALRELKSQPHSPAIAFRLKRMESLVAMTELGRSLIERLIAGKLLPPAVQAALDQDLTG